MFVAENSFLANTCSSLRGLFPEPYHWAPGACRCIHHIFYFLESCDRNHKFVSVWDSCLSKWHQLAALVNFENSSCICWNGVFVSQSSSPDCSPFSEFFSTFLWAAGIHFLLRIIGCLARVKWAFERVSNRETHTASRVWISLCYSLGGSGRLCKGRSKLIFYIVGMIYSIGLNKKKKKKKKTLYRIYL